MTTPSNKKAAVTTIDPPTTSHEAVRFWVWFRMSRLIAVYDAWPLPGIVKIAKGQDIATASPVLITFLGKFFGTNLATYASASGMGFLQSASGQARIEKQVHGLNCVAKQDPPNPVVVPIAWYAQTLADWFLRQMPASDKDWPCGVVRWAEVVLEQLRLLEIEVNPWDYEWLDHPATNHVDLGFYLQWAGSRAPGATPYGAAHAAPVAKAANAARTRRIGEVDPNQVPPDIYGYLTAVASGPIDPPPPTTQDPEVRDEPLWDWMNQLNSIVDDF